MKAMRKALSALGLGVIMTIVGMVGSAAADVPSAAIDGKRAFEVLKGLAGTWTGIAAETNGPPASIQFLVASGGTVVEEVQFPGLAHEMRSLYYLEGGNLVMTHYCGIGNQPHMRLDTARSSANELRFRLRVGDQHGSGQGHPRALGLDPPGRSGPPRGGVDRLLRSEAGRLSPLLPEPGPLRGRRSGRRREVAGNDDVGRPAPRTPSARRGTSPSAARASRPARPRRRRARRCSERGPRSRATASRGACPGSRRRSRSMATSRAVREASEISRDGL